VIFVKLVLTAIFWGGNYIAGRVVAQELPPFSIGCLRFGISSVFLFAFILRSYGRLPALKKKHIMAVFLLGMTGVFVNNGLFFTGLQTVSASRASLIGAGTPALIAIFATIIFREPVTFAKLSGIGLSVLGAMVVISHGDPLSILRGDVGRGELCLLGSGVGWMAYTLLGRWAMRELSPLVAVAYASMIGTAALLPPAAMEGVARSLWHYGATAWAAIAYMGFFGTVLAFVWYNEGIRALGPSRAAVFANLVPIVAVVMAVGILGETADLSLVVGAALVTTGIYLTNRSASSPNV
jgi:drug/metabolite transporter (DMT)-like permease